MARNVGTEHYLRGAANLAGHPARVSKLKGKVQGPELKGRESQLVVEQYLVSSISFLWSLSAFEILQRLYRDPVG
jgi:hypothetical protein